MHLKQLRQNHDVFRYLNERIAVRIMSACMLFYRLSGIVQIYGKTDALSSVPGDLFSAQPSDLIGFQSFSVSTGTGPPMPMNTNLSLPVLRIPCTWPALASTAMPFLMEYSSPSPAK
jgi:hypothetical protein